MSLKALPLLFLNMGGEMMYILDQRLKAQNIAKEKTVKVLYDIIGTMMNKKFLDELFKPQQIYPKKAMRQVFDRLAHASIMRLNSASMDKLYDLMIMAVKYQTFLCKQPQDLLLVTLNHIDTMRTFVEDSKQVVEQVDYTYHLLHANYANLSPGSFMLIRQTLLDFFQDIHIRVSIFLRDKVQHSASGRFILSNWGQLPPGVEIPGKIRLYVGRDCVKTLDFKTGAGNYALCSKEGSYEMYGDRVTPLGTNMYSAVRVSDTTVSYAGTTKTTTMQTEYDPSAADPHARAQLDLLCQLIGGGGQRGSHEGSKVEFQLSFLNAGEDEEDEDYRAVSMSPTSTAARAYNVVTIDASKKRHHDELSRIMGDMQIDASRRHNEDDDLLDLMDSLQN